MTDLRDYAIGAAKRNGVPPQMFVRQISQESGFDPGAYNAASAASGIAQIIERWHPEMLGKTTDPLASLDYAARLMASHYKRFGSWAKALAAYNWGPGNVGGYTTPLGVDVPPWDGRRETLPAETRHYLDVILGDGWPEPLANPVGNMPETMPGGGMKLSNVLQRAYGRVGDPYVWGGKLPPKTDCSGFVSWAYGGTVPSFTDAIYDATERVEKPAPGDIVLYQYADPEQPGVKFPHVGLFVSDAETLDNRYGMGVGVHPQLARIKDGGRATRYYRRLPGVTVDTDAPVGGVGPGPAATSDLDTILGLRAAVAHLADVVVVKAAESARLRDEALAEAKTIREQFVGAKP